MKKPFGFKFTHRNIFIALCCLLFLILLPATIILQNQDTKITKLNDGWAYFTDVPYANSQLESELDFKSRMNIKWTIVQDLSAMEKIKNNFNPIWFKVQLPSQLFDDQAVYFENIYGQSIEIYIDNYKVYEKVRKWRFDVNRVIIPLLQEYGGKTLYIKSSPLTGINNSGPRPNIYIGTYKHLLSVLVKKCFSNIILGGIFAFVGLMLIICSFFLRREQIKSWISLGTVILSIGIGWALYSNDLSIFGDNLDKIALIIYDAIRIIFPIALIYFFIQIFGTGYKSTIIKLFRIQSMFSIFLLVFMFINVYSEYKYNGILDLLSGDILGILYLMEFLLLIITVVYHSINGNTDAKILSIGFTCFILPIGVELLISLTFYKEYKFFVWKIGLFIFAFSQISILARRALDNYFKVIKYSSELKAANLELSNMWEELSISRDQLSEMNKTLENRVYERTEQLEKTNRDLMALNEELDVSNQELTATMEVLRDTHDQLIQSEKMAALGQLVANIAHEIKNPLGAIRSSVGLILAYIENELEFLPSFFSSMSEESRKFFLTILTVSSHNNFQSLSSREERTIRRRLTNELIENGLDNAEEYANLLVMIGIYDIKPYADFLKAPQFASVLRTSCSLSMLIRNSITIKLAAEKTSKVVLALKSYAHYNNSTNMEMANIKEGIEIVLTLYNSKIKHSIELIKNFEDVPPVLCYPDELNQVWTNLIQNALYAMDYKGTLSIDISDTNNHIIVSFTDSGSGIPEGIIGKIFQPFFTTKPQGEGSGLGLDIVKRIIDKHKGDITVESRPGRTTFTVYIPKS